MSMAGIPLLAAFADKMRWHQARQGVLAENLANAETPGFRGRDLERFSFEDQLRTSTAVMTVTTNRAHFSASSSGEAGFATQRQSGFEVTPSGNAVTLEDEMMKVAANQMDYQSVTTLYTRSMRILKTALGRG